MLSTSKLENSQESVIFSVLVLVAKGRGGGWEGESGIDKPTNSLKIPPFFFTAPYEATPAPTKYKKKKIQKF